MVIALSLSQQQLTGNYPGAEHMIKSTSSLAPSLDLRFNTAFTPGAALHLCCMLAARLS